MAFDKTQLKSGWSYSIFITALVDTFIKLSPKHQIKNPVMFAVYIGSIVVTILCSQAIYHQGLPNALFVFLIAVWLWFTVLFANFAESLAEGRGKAQADALKQSRRLINARKLESADRSAASEIVGAASLKAGDYVLVQAGDFIPSDGQVVQGIASVDESVITGESAPVIKASGSDNDSVIGNTKVISDWLVVKITANAGENFLDHMINMVQSAKRTKTPNELALTILLAALTIIFLVVCVTLLPFSIYSVQSTRSGMVVGISTLIALFVCLAPTTIGALLSTIGIAGIDRMIKANVIAFSGHAVEAAGDVDILLLDKTGTITLGNRQAVEFIPAEGIEIQALVDASYMASIMDETPEGRSIVALAQEKYGLYKHIVNRVQSKFIPFTAATRMSGIDLPNTKIRKGSAAAIEQYIKDKRRILPVSVQADIEKIASLGGTPLVVVEDENVLGVIYLKDVIKSGVKERFARLRYMGIKTIMITGDNPLTAATIAKEAGVDDYLANAIPQDKLNLIIKLQAQGHLIAMVGDGTNDAPSLAQANVGVAMNTGTQAAKEASNMVDLDSNPTKLIEVVEIGKQLLVTRGALTTFSLANDIAKYFAILPAAFSSTYPALNDLNIMNLTTSQSAVLSTVIFNALIIIFLIPLALRGINYRGGSSLSLLRRNVAIYGIGGLIVPFIGIKLLDMLLTLLSGIAL